jgi:hypothetical protein
MSTDDYNLVGVCRAFYFDFDIAACFAGSGEVLPAWFITGFGE